MLRTSVIAITLAVLLIVPGSAAGRTIGLAAGDSADFSYKVYIVTSVSDIGGVITYANALNFESQFTVNIVSVNMSSAIGDVGYRETVTEVNGTAVTATASAGYNLTAIFDPYNNNTYLAQIGFWPFAYTDLAAGNATDLPVSLILSGGNITTPQKVVNRVNVTVFRNPGSIEANFTVSAPGSQPWWGLMQYNTTTGLLYNGTIRATAFGTTRLFTYQLLAYNHPTPLNLSFVPYVVFVPIIIVIAFYVLVNRKSHKQQKDDRLRKRFGGRH